MNLHIKGIAEYYFSIDNLHHDIGNWFWIASNIEGVVYDGIKKDDAFMMCRPAFEYEDAKQELHNQVVNDITLFLYVYSGFEAIINNIQPKACKKARGKINAAKNYIKELYSPFYPSLVAYQDAIRILLSLIDQKDSDYQNLKKHFTLDDCTDINGIGIKVIYKIRNLLAHGSFSFPEPLDHSYMLPLQPEIIRLSIRIMLITSQMMIIANHNRKFGTIELYYSEVIEPNEESDEEWLVDELQFLKRFHILNCESDSSQISLKFE